MKKQKDTTPRKKKPAPVAYIYEAHGYLYFAAQEGNLKNLDEGTKVMRVVFKPTHVVPSRTSLDPL